MHKTHEHTPDTVRASFNVKKTVLDDFRKAVALKHGRLWGVLCLEFETALQTRLTELKLEVLGEEQSGKL